MIDEEDDVFDYFPRLPQKQRPEHKTTQASTPGQSSKKPSVKVQGTTDARPVPSSPVKVRGTTDARPAPSSPDYYKVLGIPRNAGPSQIGTAFWALEEKLDPRIGGSVEEYRLLGEAFEVLSDERKKKRYDQSLKMATSSTPEDEPGHPSRPPSAEEEKAATEEAPAGRGGYGGSTRETKAEAKEAAKRRGGSRGSDNNGRKTTNDTPRTCGSFGIRIDRNSCKCKVKEYSCYMKKNDGKKQRGCGQDMRDVFSDSCEDCYCARDLAQDHRCCHDETAGTYTWIPDAQLHKQMMGLGKATCPYVDDPRGKRRKLKHAQDYLCDQ